MAKEKKTSRRTFIKGVGAAATGVAATTVLANCNGDEKATAAECQPTEVTVPGDCPPVAGAPVCPQAPDGSVASPGADASTAVTPPTGGTGTSNTAPTPSPTPTTGPPADTASVNPEILPTKWDKEADVVVVGTGFAGLTTAIVAHDAGANVLILEKMSKQYEGGNSKVSGNMWWTPTNVPGGIEYIKALCYGLTDDECIETLVNEMSTLNDWISRTLNINPGALGIFQPEYPELPGSESVRTWSGGLSLFTGTAIWDPMRQQVDQRNIEVMYESPVKDLLQDPATREVKGVAVESGGKNIVIKAKKAVVLACGGFEYDFEMQKQYLPGWPVYSEGSPGNTGDGIKMAQKAGAALWHMNNALAHVGGMVIPDFDPVAVPITIPGNGYILVNSSGERFMDERRPNRHGFGHKEILFQFDGLKQTFPQLPCYGIFDNATRMAGPLSAGRSGFGWFNTHNNYNWSRDNSAELQKGWITEGASLSALGSALGINGQGLQSTVDKYNQYCQSRNDPDFNRSSTSLVALSTPPFYGVKIYPIMYNTQGGPRRNPKCQIINPLGEPIPRLYSAGELGSFWGWMYNGGGNNAECMCTGRIAGKNSSAETPWA